MVFLWNAIEWLNGAAWEPLVKATSGAHALKRTQEELNGHEEFTFTLTNNSFNRTLVSVDRDVRLKYNGVVIFTGVLSAPEYSHRTITCIVYNKAYEMLKQAVITADYSAGVAANTIFSAICTTAGVSAGICPTTSIAVKFNRANCFKAVQWLAKTLAKDYWSISTTVNIGVRNQCVLALPMDEGSGVTTEDKSGYGNNGTITGASWVDGKYGKALEFNGVGQYINVPSVSLSLPFSVCMWIKVDTTTQWMAISHGLVSEGDWYIYGDADSAVTAVIRDSVGTVYSATKLISLGGQWVFVAVVFEEGEKVKLYVNDTDPIESGSACPSIAENTDDLHIGLFASSGVYDFDGVIDEVLIFNRALTADEIEFLYNGKIKDAKPHGIDRSKRRDKIYAVGVDVNGVEIVGEAGSGTKVQVFREKKATDEVTLDLIAAQKLSELNTDISRSQIVLFTKYCALLQPGDCIPVHQPTVNLDGIFRIQKLEKGLITINCDVDRQAKSTDELLSELGNLEEIGIYQSTYTVETSSQKLDAHYRLNEGVGPVAYDSTAARLHGAITGAVWVDAPVGKMLEFGAGDYISATDEYAFSGDKISIACYVKVTASAADSNYLVYKNGQLFLQHYALDNRVRFRVYIGGSPVDCTTDAGAAPLNAFIHIVARYDGANLSIYINGKLAKSVACTGNIDSSSSILYLGASGAGTGSLVGTLYDVLIFSRAITALEVSNLYSNPLRAMATPETLEDVRIYGLDKGVSVICRAIGGVFEAIDGVTGKLRFGGFLDAGGISGASGIAVLNAASQFVDTLYTGRSALAWICVTGSWLLTKYGANDYCWKINKLTGVNAAGALFWLADEQDCDMLRVESTGLVEEYSWILGGIFEGNKEGQTGAVGDCIKVWNGSHNILQSVTVRNAAAHGIRLTGDGTSWAGLHRILDCRAYYCGNSGFVTNNQSDNTFINCIAQCNTGNGFWLLYPQQLYRCHSIGLPTISQTSGFYIQSHCHLVECYADTNQHHGFFVQEVVTDPGPPEVTDPIYQLWFNNCYAYRNGQAAYNTYDGFHLEAIDGAQLVNCRSKPKMSDPHDVNQQRNGFYLNGCDDTILSNCLGEANQQDGFFIEASTGVCLTGCKGRLNLRHGFRVETSISTSLTGCSGNNNVQNGCSVYSANYTNIIGGNYNGNDSADTATYHGVSLNTVVGGIVACVTATGNDGYQIYLSGVSTSCLVILNSVDSTDAVGGIGDAAGSATNIIKYNAGHVTENSGTAVIASGATTTGAIDHGLNITPSSGKINLTIRESPTFDIGFLWVEDISSTQFTIRCKYVPGASTLSLGWAIV